MCIYFSRIYSSLIARSLSCLFSFSLCVSRASRTLEHSFAFMFSFFSLHSRTCIFLVYHHKSFESFESFVMFDYTFFSSNKSRRRNALTCCAHSTPIKKESMITHLILARSLASSFVISMSHRHFFFPKKENWSDKKMENMENISTSYKWQCAFCTCMTKLRASNAMDIMLEARERHSFRLCSICMYDILRKQYFPAILRHIFCQLGYCCCCWCGCFCYFALCVLCACTIHTHIHSLEV